MTHRSAHTSVFCCALSLATAASVASLTAAGWARAQESATPPSARIGATAPVEARQLAVVDLRTSAGTLAAAPSRHANAEHPAVLQWRQARAGQVGLDSNRFLVQPPASVQWARESAP